MYNELESFVEVLKEDPCDNIKHEGDGCTGCPYEHLWKKSYPDEHTIAIDGSCFEFRYAEHLIKNGAVLPPVDVGDNVWYIEGGYYNSMNLKPRKIEVTEISKKKCGKTVDWAFIANRTRYRFSSLGRVVFLNEQDCIAEIERRKKQRLKQW